MREYSLNLISSFTPWRTYSSTEFFGNELRKRFEKLPHVKLHTQCFNDTEYDIKTDFALIHAYFSTNVYQHLAKLTRSCRKITSFMEEPYPHVDFNWYYSDCVSPLPFRGHMIPPPIVRSMLQNVPKEPNTILLDHDIVKFWYYRHDLLDFNERIWEWLKPFKESHKIYQLQRDEKDATPDWIEKIPHCTPEEYVRLTERMETYIITHSGSFNHTAVEMMCRGIRTLVPRNSQGSAMIPESSVRYFRPHCFSNGEELADLIRSPVDRDLWDNQIDKCLDMDGVVAFIDQAFQNWKIFLDAKEDGHPIPLHLSWL